MSQYFLTNQNGSVPTTHSSLDQPHIQFFNTPVISTPLPLIFCQDHVNPSFVTDTLSLDDISQFSLTPKEMKWPVVFDIKHSWRIFGSALDLEEGLWMFDLLGRKPLELTKHRNKGMSFKTGWIANIKIDIKDVITCTNFIMAHPAFVLGIPLPRHFDTNLLSTILQLTEQAQDIHSLAVIVMGELLVFINHWWVTVGLGWASNFSSAMHAFV